jgi:N-acetylglucosaminyl-diphospho-decaprenol L-rhamnosyltransferase
VVEAASLNLDLSIVILNYNTRDVLGACLNSVLASSFAGSIEIVVIDNCSNDGSAEMVERDFRTVTLIRSPRNGGFAFGNNLGLRVAVGRYVLLLNPDTVLPNSALATLVAFMDEHPEAGVCGPRLVRADGSLDLACRRSFPTPEVSFYRISGLSKLFPKSARFARYNLTYLDEHQLAEVDSVVGACMLVRSEAIRQAGLLDEEYFMYGEDLDWAYRIKARGWKVFYNPAATVLHYKRESAKQRPVKTITEFYRAMLIFHRKYYAARTFFLLNWLIVAGIYLRGGLALMVNRLRPREESMA